MADVFTSGAEVARYLDGVARDLNRVQKPAVKSAARIAGKAIEAEGKRFRIKGRPLSVDVTDDMVTAVPPGNWTLVEEGAKPHRISPRGNRRRRAVRVPGLGYFAHVQHPGTKSIGHPWEMGTLAAEVLASRSLDDDFGKVID